MFGRVVEFELQVGNDADDLAAIHLQPLMFFVIEQDFAHDFGERRAMLHPGAAAGVGARQMDPEPAVARGDGCVHRVGGQNFGFAVGVEAIGRYDARGRMGVW